MAHHIHFFLVRFIAAVSVLCLFPMYVILALWPPVLQYKLPALLFVCVLFVLFLLFVVVLSGGPGQNQGRGWSTPPPVQAPSNFIAGSPKAALLFWLFSDFRCGVPLFIVILVIYRYKNR